jgi:hypothetical protein
MKKTAVKLAALVATTLLLLSGCANGNPTVAATIGDNQITVAQVDSISRVLAANSTDEPAWGKWRAAVLQAQLSGRLATTVTSAAGVTITDIQRQQVYAQNELYAKLAKDPVTADFMRDYADYVLVMSATNGQSAMAQAASTVKIEVNPIFGEWDSTKAQLSGESGSLSQTLS